MENNDMEVMAVTVLPDGRMSARNAARYLGLSEKTLAMQRCDGTGPRFIKRGRIFYFREDLDDWLNASGRVTSTAQLAANRERRP